MFALKKVAELLFVVFYPLVLSFLKPLFQTDSQCCRPNRCGIPGRFGRGMRGLPSPQGMAQGGLQSMLLPGGAMSPTPTQEGVGSGTGGLASLLMRPSDSTPDYASIVILIAMVAMLMMGVIYTRGSPQQNQWTPPIPEFITTSEKVRLDDLSPDCKRELLDGVVEQVEELFETKYVPQLSNYKSLNDQLFVLIELLDDQYQKLNGRISSSYEMRIDELQASHHEKNMQINELQSRVNYYEGDEIVTEATTQDSVFSSESSSPHTSYFFSHASLPAPKLKSAKELKKRLL